MIKALKHLTRMQESSHMDLFCKKLFWKKIPTQWSAPKRHQKRFFVADAISKLYSTEYPYMYSVPSNSSQPLIFFTKSSIFGIWQGSEFASDTCEQLFLDVTQVYL